MKVSICFPQYNRIEYLLTSLSIIENQTYSNIEICISDDASSDNTLKEIKNLTGSYKFPINYHRFSENVGYDRNYRKSIEMANGEYAFVLGNDDSLNGVDTIQNLVFFLQKNNLPEIGFCNMIEEISNNALIERAKMTSVLGNGPEVALNYYSSFSFVGGLIFKKDSFLKYNTSKYDKSIYAQMYLAVLMIASGETLFSIKEPLVIKDLVLNEAVRGSYRDRLIRTWSDFKIVDGGLPSVINVLINAIYDSGFGSQKNYYKIYKRIYQVTYPYWLLDYRENKAFINAVGLSIGLNPSRYINIKKLSFFNRAKIILIFWMSTIIGLLFPVFLFKKVKSKLYKIFKK